MNKKIISVLSVFMALVLTIVSSYSAHAASANPLLIAAKQYYVSTSGQDVNSGTLASPYATISKAMSMAVAGDAIYVRAGQYPSFSVSKSGLTIAGYNGEMPVISGGKGIECSKKTDIIIQGFEVIGATGNYIGGITLDNCNNVVIVGNKIHDNIATSVSGIVILGSNNKILNNEIYNNNLSGVRLYGSSVSNEIGFNTIHNHSLSAGNSDGIGIADLNVTQTNIHDNTVFANSDDGIDTWASPGNLVKNNVSYGNGGTGDGNGFKMGGSTTGGNNIVSGNISYSNKACGFTSNGSGDYYEGNTSYNNATCGFSDVARNAGNTQTSSFINNVAYNNPGGNFKKNATYTTVFLGNTETLGGVTPTATTSVAVPTRTSTSVVMMPSPTSVKILPSVTPTSANIATQTQIVFPVSPTATQRIIASPTQTALSQPTQIASVPTKQSSNPSQTVVDIRVAAGKDDVEESSTGSMYINSSDLELVYDSGNHQVVGIRFVGVNIPKGATINNAYLQFRVDETSSNASALSIQGEASPNALAFTSYARNVSSRVRTIKAVNWSPSSWTTVGAVGANQRTPNLAPIVQEIVSQSGWASGNSIVMLISGSGKRVAEAYEVNPSGAPLLHIEYTVTQPNLAFTATASPTYTVTVVSPTYTSTMVSPTSTQVPATSTTVPVTPTISVTDTPVPTNAPIEAPSETPTAIP